MSIQKKSLISNRVAVKKALIASQPAEVGEANELKANSLTAQSMKKKRLAISAFKTTAFRVMSLKRK
jgi:hypothetical protein